MIIKSINNKIILVIDVNELSLFISFKKEENKLNKTVLNGTNYEYRYTL